MTEATISYPVRFERRTLRTIMSNAKRVQLSGADIIRQSVEAGMPLVLARLSHPGRVTNVEPLPRGVLTRLYRDEDPAWAKLEAAATRHSVKPSFEE